MKCFVKHEISSCYWDCVDKISTGDFLSWISEELRTGSCCTGNPFTPRAAKTGLTILEILN